MDLLFTKEELGTKRFKVTRKRGDREPLPTLDQSKVKLIDGKCNSTKLVD